mgnify:FL=1
MHIQRVRELRAGLKRSLPNGPLRVQSKEFIKEVCKISDWILIYNSEYSVTWRHTSVAGDMIVSRKVHGKFHESRWHRGNKLDLPSLTE